MTEARANLDLDPDTRAAAAARRFVRGVLAGRASSDLVETASLIASELVTNAVLHAGTSITVTVERSDAGTVRLEVADHSPGPPAPRHYSEDSATGRGLIMVDALAERWGVDPDEPEPGKTIWVEIGEYDSPSGHHGPVSTGQAHPITGSGGEGGREVIEADSPLAGLSSGAGGVPAPAEGTVEVRLLGLPLDVYQRAAEHSAELQREFALILERDPSEDVRPPGRLLSLIQQLNARFGVFGGTARAQLEAALGEAGAAVDLSFTVPSAMGPAVAELGGLFDEADAYCRAGELLTLATPPEALAFRRWFFGQIVDQSAGAQPTSWVSWQAGHRDEETRES